jgi:VanZ family protein
VSARSLRVVVYAAVVFYGSLFPFVGWRATHEGLLDFLAHVPDFHVNRADSLSNVLAYVPLGLFLVRALNRPGPLASVLLATLGGTALSFAMEFLQQFVPGRVASPQDAIRDPGAVCYASRVAPRFPAHAPGVRARMESAIRAWSLR